MMSWCTFGRAAMFWCLASAVYADLTASVDACITVPSILCVEGPVDPVTLVHDGTDAVQSFSVQTFTVQSNQINGATVSVRCIGGFINTSNSLLLRDCTLGLSVTGSDSGSGWVVDVDSDETDVDNLIPDLIAEVRTSSDAPGDAAFGVSIGMDGGLASTLPPGVYCTTVIATVIAN